MEGRSLALTVQEIAECRSEEELFDLETNGFVVVEILLFLYAILAMHVLLEEWYVPALELVTSPDVLDVPRPLLGCTIMAAGNCLPELSMSLIALLWTGSADIGTGEVFGSCVFNILAILGVVCVRLPEPSGELAPSKEPHGRWSPTRFFGESGHTPQLARPLMLYFLGWTVIATLIDMSLFSTTVESTWILSITMVSGYTLFVVGVFACHFLYPNKFAVEEISLPIVSSAAGGGEQQQQGNYGSALPTEPASTAPLALPSPPPSPPTSTVTIDGKRVPSTVLTAAQPTALAPAPSTAIDYDAPPEGEGEDYGEEAGGESVMASGGTLLLSPPRESTPLLITDTTPPPPPPPPHGEGSSAPSDSKAESTGSAASKLTERVLETLSIPPRILFRWTVPDPNTPYFLLGNNRPWGITILICITYTLLLSYAMVAIATRGVCLLGVRKNSLGATVLCLSAGFPDLITAMILVRRPGNGMVEMAVANPFGAFLFNALVALGLPWLILGSYADVFPPARGTWFPSLVGFGCIGIALLLLLANRLRVSKSLGYALLGLYLAYLAVIIHDGTTRMARPPA